MTLRTDLEASLELETLRAEVKRLEHCLKRIADDERGECHRLLIHPSVCKRAYLARLALSAKP